MAIHKIIIHCAATPNGKRLGAAGASQAQVIDRWHGQRGFRRRDTNAAQHNPHLKHIGYHFVIGVTGTVETGRAVGEQGAHVKGHNRHSIGICMIGTDKFTKAQWQSLYDLIKSLSKQYPDASLKGHRDYSPDLDGDGTIEPHEYTKICPGFDVAEWIDNDFEPWPEHVCIIKK
ncbi:MAG: N-acetylmuramoyl-L-alanine amidase [Gammaproteobacteria bacterium]|nr:N-acetylmuramoyl-L-alanine amidase [Gammaproteobacteria bacterium]